MSNHKYYLGLIVSILALNLININEFRVDCKPVELFRQHRSKTIIRSPHDLIALANEESTETPVHYVTVEQPEQRHHQHPQQQQHQQPEAAGQPAPEAINKHEQNQQEVIYYMMPDGQTIEASQFIAQQEQLERQNNDQHNDHHQAKPSEVPCDHAKAANYQTVAVENASNQPVVETTAEQVADGYPGEIVYTNQAGELLRQVYGGGYEPIEQTNPQDKYNRPSIELVTKTGKSLRESARDLTATILTEIPLNDISQEVLEQLKKDYGAKVVATREHPGANLIINCSEHSGLDVSLCSSSRQPPIASYEPTYETVEPRGPYVVEEHAVEVTQPTTLTPDGYEQDSGAVHHEQDGEIEAPARHQHDVEAEHEKNVHKAENHDDHDQRDHHRRHPTDYKNDHEDNNQSHDAPSRYEYEVQPKNRANHEQSHEYSTYLPSTTPVYEESPTTQDQAGETTRADQVAPTSGYNMESAEVTSSATNQREQKVSPRSVYSKERVKSEEIRQRPDALSSISQQEEKIEK